jgi:hypothetical protein
MGEIYTSGGVEAEQQAIAERCLTEVDHLSRLRLPDGSHAESTLQAVSVNLQTAVKEAAMPYAVSTTHQEYRDGTFWWLDQNPVQVAESGYKFHKSQAAFERVAIEVEEAQDVERNLRPGFIKVFISPKMSEADAPRKVAEQEHLADDDMVRIHMLDLDENQAVRGKFMQSLLVRHIPLRAWTAMLRDPNNIFGKPITLEDERSALSVMKVHHELELPEVALPEGVVSLIEAVVPYLATEERREVEAQLLLFRDDQVGLEQKARNIADRWLGFEVALSDSLHLGRAVSEVEQFINQLQHQWGDETQQLLAMHRMNDGSLFMSRELAVKLEQARQNTLWVSAAVATGNQRVLGQMDEQAAQAIYNNEMVIQRMMAEGFTAQQISMMEATANRTIAQQNVEVGGGCPGNNKADFKNNSDPDSDDDRPRDASEAAGEKGGNSKEGPSKKKWMHCPYCRAEKFDDPCAKQLYCGGCRGLVRNSKVLYAGNVGLKEKAEQEQALIKELEEIFANMELGKLPPTPEEEPQQAEVSVKTGQLALAGAGAPVA